MSQSFSFINREDQVHLIKQHFKAQKSSLVDFMSKMMVINENPEYYISQFAQNTRGLNNLLYTSKGRDKFCQLIQYLANLYVTCMKSSEEYASAVKNKEIQSVLRARSLEDNISNGRKIFRFLLFLNEINELNEIIKNTKCTMLLKGLKICSTMCSFNYYLFDNIVWLSQIGILNKFIIPKFKWKMLKDAFSFLKTIFEVIISIYVVIIKKRKEREIMEQLSHYQGQKIKSDQHSYVLMRNLILIRRKIRFHQMEVFIYVLRMLMLVSALRLVGHKYLDPIFVSTCGLLQAFSNVFKSMKGKKKFYKLTIDSLKAKGSNIASPAKQHNNTLILTEEEFQKRERELNLQHHQQHQSENDVGYAHDQSNDEQLSDFQNNHQEKSLSTGSNSPINDDIPIEEEEDEEEDNHQEQIDDIYDQNSVKPFYELQSLRKNWVINQMDLMQLKEQ